MLIFIAFECKYPSSKMNLSMHFRKWNGALIFLILLKWGYGVKYCMISYFNLGMNYFILHMLSLNSINIIRCNKHTACGWIWAHKDLEILEMVVDVKIWSPCQGHVATFVFPLPNYKQLIGSASHFSCQGCF